MNTQKINILFPVEIANRELDYRLFLACMCARPTNRIFIGQHDAVFRLSQYLKGGIYVGRNVFDGDGFGSDANLAKYRALKNRDFVVVFLDEEGAFFGGDGTALKNALLRKLNPTCLSEEDYVCAWGDFQKDFYQSLRPSCTGHVYTTGH